MTLTTSQITTPIITWRINQLERQLPSGLVYIAHWTCSAVEGEYSGSVYGTQGLEATDPESSTFVPYEDITEELALEWLFDAMQEEQVQAHEANVLSQIEAKKNPVTSSGLPW